ncbi:BglG family transcription antiterminator [[Eubacterium] hominis]|uniref:BglG family transcription antiterminator n=1 Tax=[Eubacterium] hominis TaxID=2764325 RepID=UPI003A4D7626
MPLNRRQLNMLKDFYENKENFLTSRFFADKYDISIRSVKNDLSIIRQELEDQDFIELESMPSKGTKMILLDEEEYHQYMQDMQGEDDLNSKDNRIHKILEILLETKKYYTVQHLADRFFISKSTFLKDLKQVKQILQGYHIEIEHDLKKGIQIKGKEEDIRKCISSEHVNFMGDYANLYTQNDQTTNFNKIGAILVNVFMEYQYQISDVALQNLIIHIDILIKRVTGGFVMEEARQDEIHVPFMKEIEMAEKIIHACHEAFHIPIHEAEVQRLAIYLYGKANLNDASYITQEIDDFVFQALTSIKNKYAVDIMDNVQFRVSLSLHLMPLLTRLKYNMQLKNELLHNLRQSYQVAFDMAFSLSSMIKEHFGYELNEDEISYLAIYFNSALEAHEEHAGTKRMLIISSLKRSETLLLREKIKSWFANTLSELVIEDIYHLEHVDVSTFDVICTTEKNKFYENNLAILISQFPKEEDYRAIKMMLDGFNNKEQFEALFTEANFYIGKPMKQEQVIKQLCKLSTKDTLSCKQLYEEVMKRETMGGTYFGNAIAMPHPMYPITENTLIAVALLEKEIPWDTYGNMVQLILLVSVEKNNPKAYKIWSYLTEMIHDEKLIEAILKEPSYQNFKKQISAFLDKTNFA